MPDRFLFRDRRHSPQSRRAPDRVEGGSWKQRMTFRICYTGVPAIDIAWENRFVARAYQKNLRRPIGVDFRTNVAPMGIDGYIGEIVPTQPGICPVSCSAAHPHNSSNISRLNI